MNSTLTSKRANPKLEQLRAMIAQHLAEIAETLPPDEWKLTFIARKIGENETTADILVGDDESYDEVMATVMRLSRRPIIGRKMT